MVYDDEARKSGKGSLISMTLIVNTLLMRVLYPLVVIGSLMLQKAGFTVRHGSSGGLGLIGSDYQWGEDPATLCIALASLVLLAWLISRIVKLIIRRW
ncbi:hypothetical protein [Erwinia amylovora]|uniref:hypothetical protein n=1 Tax=Erwinia amylovora TaxID=552 RepID=UPI001F04E5E5|nr:hypothetical protein [Erwinia amylovora]